jgi:uncharacterized FlaG/YvyC family protein
MSENDLLEEIRKAADRSKHKTDFAEGVVAISSLRYELDDRINFRVNSVLKSEFEKLCDKNHTTISREIKRFMTEAIRVQKLI